MTTLDRTAPDRLSGLHPWLAVLVAGAVPLWLGGLLSDIAYARTYEIQWLNFAAWLVAGAMVFTGLALAAALLRAVLRRSREALVLTGVLLLAFVFGLVDNLIHAQDAWAAMPGGLMWSVVVTLLILAALWISVSGLPGRFGRGEVQS